MKVSICMISYNQEKFVAQAVESVMMQDVNFEVELVIGEDCSTDSTREVLLELRDKYVGNIKLLLPENNLGMSRNFFETVRVCDGDYIALLEGDDYWTSPTKIANQVAFLEANPQCVACFHDVQVIGNCTEGIMGVAHAQTDPTFQFLEPPQEVLSIENLLLENYIPTCSFMVRHDAIQHIARSLSDSFSHLKLVDWPLFILLAQYGDIGWIKGAWATYRLHEGGVWSGKNRIYRAEKACEMYETLLPLLPSWTEVIKLCLRNCVWFLVLEYEKDGNITAAKSYLSRYLRISPLKNVIKPNVFKAIFRIHARKIYCAIVLVRAKIQKIKRSIMEI